MKPTELPIRPFASKAKWADWLAKNHDKSRGVWIKHAKQASGLASVSYDEAVEVALCFGWIDGQKKSLDAQYWLQKYTPRGPKSIWSKINTEKAERLIATEAMQPAGLRAVEAAKANGRWEQAYASQQSISVPKDFRAALDQNPAAREFFATLKGAERYSFLFRLETARRPETRARRIREFVEKLARHEKTYLFKPPT